MDNKSRLRFEILKTALAIGISLVLVFAIILLVSHQPLSAIQAMLTGPFCTSLCRIARRFRRVGN